MKPSPQMIKQFAARALSGMEGLPLTQQAELHETAAEVLREVAPDCADASTTAAKALRLADEHQLYLFAALKEPARPAGHDGNGDQQHH